MHTNSVPGGGRTLFNFKGASFVALLLGAFWASAPAASAQEGEFIWANGGQSNEWSDPSNWLEHESPSGTFTGVVLFTGTGTSDQNISSSFPGALDFDNTGTFTLTGESFLFDGQAITLGSGPVIIENPIVLEGASPISSGSSSNLTLTGGVTGAGTLLWGAGDLTLSGSNDFGNGSLEAGGGNVTIASGASLTNTSVDFGGTTLLIDGTITGGDFQLEGNDTTATLQSSGTLTTGETDVGDSGSSAAVFTQNGGNHTTSRLVLSYAPPGGPDSEEPSTPGTYHLNGGTLTTASISSGGGSSAIYFNGGTLIASDNNPEFFEGLTGAYIQSGGLTLDNGGYNITVSQPLLSDPALNGATDGGAAFQGSGTTTLAGASTYTGTTSINAGTVVVASGGSLNGTAEIDVAGGAVFTIDNGSVAPGNEGSLALGTSGTAPATANLSFGTLTVGETEIGVAGGSTGIFNQTGGTHNADSLFVGVSSTSTGTYNLSGGTFNTYYMSIGVDGTGVFNQTGGTVNNGDELLVGTGAGSVGIYTQSGGSNSSLYLYLDAVSGAQGTYNLDGGTLTTSGIQDLHAGFSAFNFDGGTLVASGGDGSVPFGAVPFLSGVSSLTVGANGGTIDNGGFGITFADGLAHNAALGANPDGGLVFQGSGTTTLAAPGTYNGGTTITAGAVDLTADTAAGTGNITLKGGELIGSADIGNQIVLAQSQNTLAATAGDTFTLDGTINFTSSPTTLTIGDPVNTGTVVITSDLSLGANNVQITSGVTLDGQGSIELSGGEVGGAGTLVNDGTVSGSGTVASGFVNESDGVVSVGSPGTLRIASGFTNNGLVEVLSSGAVLSGGQITNQGQIEGYGNIRNAIANTSGSIEALGGTLDLTGNVSNGAHGTISAAAGNEVLVAQGLATNAGLISLSGGEFNNNNQSLDNTGLISGYGTLSTGTSATTSSGTVDFAGGTTTVQGGFNVTGGTVDIYNTATFDGAVQISGGAVTTHAANAIFARGLTVNGGSYFNDPSITQAAFISVGPAGSIGGGAGSLYQVSGDVDNQSQYNLLSTSTLEFVAPGDANTNQHALTWSVTTGKTDLGTLLVDSGQTLQTQNSEDGSTGSLHVAAVELNFVIDASESAPGGLLSTSQLTTDVDSVLTGGNLIIYYDANNSANSYLQDETILYGDGGELIAVTPEPQTWALLVAGLILLCWQARRKLVRPR